MAHFEALFNNRPKQKKTKQKNKKTWKKRLEATGWPILKRSSIIAHENVDQKFPTNIRPLAQITCDMCVCVCVCVCECVCVYG